MSKKEHKKLSWTYKDDIGWFCMLFHVFWVDRYIYKAIEEELNGKTFLLETQSK